MSNPEFARIVGRRLKRIREQKGLTRIDLAKAIGVDNTALSCWEAGKYMPRDKTRAPLAHALGVEVHNLFDPREEEDEMPIRATMPTDDDQVSVLLSGLVKRSRHLKMLRFSYPFSTAARYRQEFRQTVSARILDNSLELLRAEVFYNLDRLKEVLSNILRYDGRSYWVKGFAVTGMDVFPGIDFCIGDHDDCLLSAVWNSVPADDRPRLWLSGKPVSGFVRAYWNEAWHRGRLLNVNGAHDLSAVRDLAIILGLKSDGWTEFLDAARSFKMGDGAPPMP